MYKTRPKIKEIVEEYKHVLKRMGIHVERAILYGSFAKGNQREDSDIDLVVISTDFQNMNLRERLEVLGIAAVRIMKPIEARGYTPKETEKTLSSGFLNEILEAGVSL